MLEVRDIETGYGEKQVLFGVSLAADQGEIVALIGPNGAGKSTLLKAVCGLLPAWKGEVLFDGTSTGEATPAQNVARGITFAPQGSRVFDELTVLENLEMGGYQLHRRDLPSHVDSVLEFFPILRERTRQIAGRLSGGEQQMLALARALVPRPKLLLLDEPSLGLSPDLVERVFDHVTKIHEEMPTTILIVEQKVRRVLGIADRAYALKLGKVAAMGAAADMNDHEKLRGIFT